MGYRIKSMLTRMSWVIFTLSFICLSAREISQQEALAIGQKIWMNECNQTLQGLLTWNQGEEFASLGIGHFIWYPIGKTGVFEETFPFLIQFLKDKDVQLPPWLSPKTACPWHSREEFEKKKRSGKMKELHALLIRTVSLQAEFMAQRFHRSAPNLVKELSTSEATHVKAQIERLFQVEGGTYALLDYLNFKGEGTNPIECYRGKGWGLLQVLLRMPGNTDDPLEEFASSAEKTLIDRVERAPVERDEARWLPGWLNRIKTYHPLP